MFVMRYMKLLTLLFLALLAIILPACKSATEAKARDQAQKDIQAGKPEYRVYGKRSSHDDFLAKILKTEYGVILHPVAGCLVTKELCEETKAYNAVVSEHLKGLYHKDVFAAAQEAYMKQLDNFYSERSSVIPSK